MTEIIRQKIRNLWKNFAVYVWYSGRKKAIDPINPIFYLRKRHEAHARQQLEKNVALWTLLSSMIAASDSTGCEYGDYYELHRTLMRFRPKYVVECGSGISSCVIAYTLDQLHSQTGLEYVFVSM